MAEAVAGDEFAPKDISCLDMPPWWRERMRRRRLSASSPSAALKAFLKRATLNAATVRIGTLPAASIPDGVRVQVGEHLFGVPPEVRPRWG